MRNSIFNPFEDDPFTTGLSLFNSMLTESRKVMEELMNDPNTKVYKSPDGTTTYVNYSSNLSKMLPSKANKMIVSSNYPPTNVYEDESGNFHIEMAVAGYKNENIYTDFKDGYLNVVLTKKPWKEVLTKANADGTYSLPDDVEDEDETKEIEKNYWIQHGIKEPKVAEQNILFDTTKYDIRQLKKTLEDGMLTFIAPAKEEARPTLLTFND